MLVSDSQDAKVADPMLVKPLGRVMSARDVQLLKAFSPMLVTLSGMVMLTSDLQVMYPLLVDYQYYAAIKVEINGDAFRKSFCR